MICYDIKCFTLVMCIFFLKKKMETIDGKRENYKGGFLLPLIPMNDKRRRKVRMIPNVRSEAAQFTTKYVLKLKFLLRSCPTREGNLDKMS